MYFQAALKLRRDFYQNTPHIDLLRSYINIGSCYSREGRHLDALRYYDSADVREEAFMVFPYIYNSVKKAESLLELGSLSQGQIQLENAYQQVHKIAKGEIRPDPVSLAKASKFLYDLMVNYAANLQRQKRFAEALQKGIEGLELVRTFGPPSDSSFQLAMLFLTLGNIAQDSAKEAISPNLVYPVAHGYYDQAITYFAAAGNVVEIILTLSNKGSIYEKAGDYQKAESSLRDAIGLLNRFFAGNNPQSLPLIINLGTVLARQGRYDEALAAYQNALAKIDSNAASRKMLPDIQGLYKKYDQSLVLLGSLGRLHLWLAEKNPQHVEASQTSYDSLASLINFVRANLIDD
ncbi:MAG TPA: tetratricopeptide repeat protein, partial [Saprospiraceae bacterium]|nr:tetratricopeptide repeat protein [Saprospiraceae bacterium]